MSAARKYVQKPPVVEAIQWDGENTQAVVDFMGAEAGHRIFGGVLRLGVKQGHGVMEYAGVVGSYWMRDHLGKCSTMSAKDFDATFEAQPEPEFRAEQKGEFGWR